jgi:hypothetical protein
MGVSQVYVVIAVGVLAAVAVLVFLVGRRGERNRLTPLAGLAWACILAGLMFGESRALGYGLLAVGVSLAVVDMVRRLRETRFTPGAKQRGGAPKGTTWE